MQGEISDLKNAVKSLKHVIFLHMIVTACLLLVGLFYTSPAATQPPSTSAKISNISIGHESSYMPAKARGYYTASEYARITRQSLQTVYIHANAGKIKGATKCDGKWRFLLITP
jgi:hypothetical protein